MPKEIFIFSPIKLIHFLFSWINQIRDKTVIFMTLMFGLAAYFPLFMNGIMVRYVLHEI